VSTHSQPWSRHARKRPRMTPGGRALRVPSVLFAVVLMAGILPTAVAPVAAADPLDIPPAVDPGTPVFKGSATPVPAPPVEFDPTANMLRRIYDADVAAGGDSFWLDRTLERPFLDNSSGERTLLTRGRALYMYTHNPSVLGFAGQGTGANGGGGYAYRQPPTTGNVALYTIGISNATLTETTAERLQYPSYFTSLYTGGGLSVRERKYITYNDTAVTDLTITNTGASATTRTVSAQSPIAPTAAADGTELTGNVTLRYGLTTFRTRFSGDGFIAAGNALSRSISLDPGQSIRFKIQLGAIAAELPDSASEYARYRDADPDGAFHAQLREYNAFWTNTVPYVDLPDKNVEKISWYRTWENRFNTFDGNIPGNDYQFPVDLEGALGYNNQISLTVPMRLQDLQFWRDPLYSYGPWLSQGEESGCQSFHDNPGNTGNWNNTYEQWTALQAWESYKVHGGPIDVLRNLAHYSECDVKETLAKFDTDGDHLIEYTSGTLPGNDADSVAFKYYGTGTQGREDRTESSFWYAGARAAAEEYALLGNTAKAAEMNGIADQIRTAILTNLWADGEVTNAPVAANCNATGDRVPGRIGNGLHLCGTAEYVNLPAGIVSSLHDFTISVWVNPSVDRTWSRIFDFGTGTTRNMFLTMDGAGIGPRFAITTSGSGGEQQLTRPGQLPLNTWSHLAVTVSGTIGTLYIDGAAVATNTNMTLDPADLGSTNQNWIGRSQYGDPLFNGTVDDFHIYDHALTADEIASLAAPTQGAGNVAAYRFDEASGPTAVDSSGNGLDATIVSEPKPTITCPGNVFLQRHLPTDNLVCWKDQQNFTPFIDGVPPDTAQYTQALRYYADKAEFGIMPIYTADQADYQAALACGPCDHGSNNFSNINATLQARLYSKAIRDYPTPYITNGMYRRLIEWLSWNEDINGDNRFPDNNEFFFNWNPTTQTLGRSGIHHDVLGSYNWMVFQDIAGLHPRLDGTVELWPIDMGYDHFAVNNLSYHGTDLTIVWQKPGSGAYPLAPDGYSLYVGGKRVLTVDRLAHLTWNSASGAVDVLDGGTTVAFHAAGSLDGATDVSLTANRRVTEAFQNAGLDLYPAAGAAGAKTNLALGATATASFTTTSPASQATDPSNAVDGSTTSGLPVTSGAYVATNPIWGTRGSPNTTDWLQLDLGKPTTIDTLRLYFYSNKTFGSGGNTYREPARYDVQYFDGTSWQTAPGQLKAPAAPKPNANEVVFRPVTAQLFRVLVVPTGTFGVGIKEVQAFDTTPLGTGFWANTNGKAIIAGGGSTDGVCDVGTYLRGYAPFADLSATATCDQVSSYVAAVVKAASCSGSSCNTMLKAQMLTTALGLFFRDPTMSAADVDLSASSAAFGGASHLTIDAMLAFAASQSNSGGTAWYGQVKATQVLAKDAFMAINDQSAASPP
jgi:concanavalin A-like lectin/glucanase superfamily protein/F5/8 type C domain-containing protein